MPEILDDRATHALVQFDDGEVELIPWSSLNTLVYKHGLDDLLITGSESLITETDAGTRITLEPEEDATVFYLTIDPADKPTETVKIPPHKKSILLDALEEMYAGDERTPTTLLDVASDILDTAVNPHLVDPLADHPMFEDDVVVESDGWLIHDHVKLSYDNTLHHPNTNRSRRDGTVLPESSNKIAYELRFRAHREDGQTDLDSFEAATSADATVDFLARALWAVTYTPEEEPA